MAHLFMYLAPRNHRAGTREHGYALPGASLGWQPVALTSTHHTPVPHHTTGHQLLLVDNQLHAA
jgi:hypothetical protein